MGGEGKCAIVLIDVMTWIKNWDAGFLEDNSGEWQITEANVQAALKAAGASEAQLEKARTYAFDETVEPTL